ncbi:uncharacterized protein Z518_07353 [Rhinocladiella mackenziei CBS 650.93]|uniref:Zn(2)-C6 fungal-type domain-containing protein n=1 Tax=Rhinocladiella mackenziei CBS 650.93 TaxID=1442369 RepID=A0A0D2J460_9EURO|nr:uncharacterized protein Z518_07353 [Rhinocladiella mackenziei CBS 650.93]KIX03800.1 hypothetical protein Z518_07353 [Rhinocladiella mackenziei CBS 650.93]
MYTTSDHVGNERHTITVSASPHRPDKLRRTRSGCMICRRRKVKCDERTGGCANCERLRLDCPGYQEKEGFAVVRRMSSLEDTMLGVTANQAPAEIGSTDESRVPVPNPVAITPAVLESLSWLQSDRLPELKYVRDLVENYFAVFHPLRCFGFLHKPSFLQSLDDGSATERDDALLHIVCSLGAKYVGSARERLLPTKWILTTGNKWAERALAKILHSLSQISVENLMAAVLLQDHQIRLGKYSTAFMLTGFTARMAQALQINLEFSSDILSHDGTDAIDATTKESRRRLMWACYITDASVGSGVDQLTLLHEEDIKIQLPCDERLFMLQTACVTELLEPGEVLSFIPERLLPPKPTDNMGLTAFYIRLVAIRKKILRQFLSEYRYVKQLHSAMPPWLPESEFTALKNECTDWHSSLPQNLQLNPSTLYIRAETGELGALCFLHATYSATLIDLYRIFVPRLYKLRSTFDFPYQQQDYLAQRKMELYDHAKSIANIIVEAIHRQGPSALADFWWPSITYESCRHMVYYVTQVQPSRRDLMSETTTFLKSNINALKAMQSLCAMADPLSIAAEKMLSKLNIAGDTHNLGPEDPMESDEAVAYSSTAPGTPAQSAPDYVLHPLSIYRMARKSIPEKHAPEKTVSPTATTHTPNSSISLQARHHVSPNGTHRAVDGQNVTSHHPLPDIRENPLRHETWIDEELQLLYPSEMTSFWEPAATFADGSYNAELPTWITDFHQDQSWLDYWPGTRD